MNEQQQPPPPSLPREHPKLNGKLLWLALLAPTLVMGSLTLGAFAHLKFDFISLALGLGSLAVLGGWILLGIILFKRMPTVGYVFTLLGYPIIQGLICVTLFFFGCLTSVGGNWGHSAPDSWVEEQERRARENTITPEELEDAKGNAEEATEGIEPDLSPEQETTQPLPE